MKTSELIGPALDWAVAKCENILVKSKYPDEFWDNEGGCCDGDLWSEAWTLGGPIISNKEISIRYEEDGKNWHSFCGNDPYGHTTHAYGPTPLIAAMRCYVASKLGNEVDIPEELLE